MDWRGIHRPTIIAFLALAILLVGAGAVIYRNINKLSRLEYENQRRFLSSALFSFRREFSGALLDLTRAFSPPIWTRTNEGLQRQLVDRYQLLLEEQSNLNLIDQLFLLVYSADRAETFFRFDPNQTLFLEQKLPESLREIESSLLPRRVPRTRGGASRLELVNKQFFLSIPHPADRRGFRRGRRGPPGPPPPFPPGAGAEPDRLKGSDAQQEESRGFLILLSLDRGYFEREILPRLAESYFRRPLLQGFEVAILSEAGEAIVCVGDEGLDPAFFRLPDATLPLVAPGGWLFPLIFSMGPQLDVDSQFPQESSLNLVARHRAGSLRTAIGQRRTRDLLEAFGILLLLAGAAFTLVVSVQRTRMLARRQMDFVAGISHELRNPLTAIQSAGFNLSKGTVHDANSVQKYGQVISRESRRLTHMVEQVLSYAGIQSSGRRYDLKPVRLEEVLEVVLQEYAQVLQEENWKIEVRIDENLPFLLADPEALRSCLSNLIDNSLKYADDTKCLEIDATSRQASGRIWVDISVQDKGQGIVSTELSQVFNPFYRGAEHVASSTPGTGLGLALVKRHVQAHGGRVQVQSISGAGARFLLSFPAVKDSDETPKDKNGA